MQAFSFSYSQQIKIKNLKSITRDFSKDIHNLLKEGQVKVDIMDIVKMSPRRLELLMKFKRARENNPEWFMKQENFVTQSGKPITYDKKLGMTETEFEEFKSHIKNNDGMEVVSSGVSNITITKDSNNIYFKAYSKLSDLSFFVIDIKNKIVKFKKDTLTLVDTICVTNSKNAFKTSWRGYKFEYSNPKVPIAPTSKEELGKFSLLLYSFTIGLFDKSGKTHIEFGVSEIENGIQKSKFKIPISIE
jgi:predicted RNA-binding protein with RPS1 domain